MQPSPSFKKLSLFAVTNLVVGAIVGADVYIVACLGFQYLGPASLVAWMSAGLIARVASRVMESAKNGAVKMLETTPMIMVSRSIATNRIATPS